MAGIKLPEENVEYFISDYNGNGLECFRTEIERDERVLVIIDYIENETGAERERERIGR